MRRGLKKVQSRDGTSQENRRGIGMGWRGLSRVPRSRMKVYQVAV